MIKTGARNTSLTLVRVLDYTVVSAMSTSVKVTSNLFSAVLGHYTVILLTLKISYNAAFLRVDINVVILII